MKCYHLARLYAFISEQQQRFVLPSYPGRTLRKNFRKAVVARQFFLKSSCRERQRDAISKAAKRKPPPATTATATTTTTTTTPTTTMTKTKTKTAAAAPPPPPPQQQPQQGYFKHFQISHPWCKFFATFSGSSRTFGT